MENLVKTKTFKCENCNTEFEDDPTAQGYRACSPECIEILRDRDIAIAEYNWLDEEAPNDH